MTTNNTSTVLNADNFGRAVNVARAFLDANRTANSVEVFVNDRSETLVFHRNGLNGVRVRFALRGVQ